MGAKWKWQRITVGQGYFTGLQDFQEAIEAAENKLKESGSGGINDFSQALQILKEKNTLGEIITKIAEGLRTFIGYGSQGKGIADVIDPLQQLRKGVLEFLRMFLDRLRGLNVKVQDAIGELNKARMGRVKFDEAVQKVKKISQTGSNTNDIPDVMSALINVDELKQHKDDLNTFPEAVNKYLKNVLEAVVKDGNGQAPNQVASLQSSLPALVEAYGKQNGEHRQLFHKVEGDYKMINRNSSRNVGEILGSAVYYGTENMLIPLKKTDGYKSSYISSSSWNGGADNNTISQIFLGCLPLYYYWLTYLYWKCKQPYDRHGWEGQWLHSGVLNAFMVGHGYVTVHLTKHPGKNIAPLLENVDKLKDSIQGISSPTAVQASHADILSELSKKLDEALKTPSTTTLNGHSLSALFYLCRCYFIGKQIINPATERRPPTSIREMLYWLSGLQFSPYYSDLKKHIEKNIPNHGLPVADSSISSTKSSGGDTLTQSQMKGFLLSSCLSAPGVLGAIQGNSADRDGEPWLYSLFCNTMNLQYPSGSALFNTLANYVYALQFQLYFLYRQCQNNYSYTCGWNECAFGANVTISNTVQSYLCPSRGGDCSSQGSPLQAFLTDNLKGFCRQQPGTSNHLTECSPGSMCHVPMGFAGKLRTDAGGGINIAYALNPFCSSPSDPLRQLSEKLGCLTKRTPRTLGDLIGFIWHLNGQLFKKRPTIESLINKFSSAFSLGSITAELKKNRHLVVTMLWNGVAKRKYTSLHPPVSATITGLSLSLESMVSTIPFLYQLFLAEEEKSLPVTLFDLTQHCHEKKEEQGTVGGHNKNVTKIKHKCTNTSNDLWSIFQSLNVKPSKAGDTDPYEACRNSQCGGYLSPLTHTYGATYSPKFASTYLSWVVYLVEVFDERLNELLVEFNNINCKDCAPHCSCTEGQHGSTSCQCDSVVSCAGVLPVFYAHGFNFTNAYALKGGTHGTDTMKRSCQKFHDQLSNVLAEGAPLTKLLLTIDDFLYMFRFYFVYNLSSIWIMYVCVVLYIYFYRADLLHVKSHVRFPSSHGIPPIGLLPTGKPTVLTKFTKLTYFIGELT
ncbi:extracellular matrix-binding ebh [Babesia caballi]|uniref:Extracellular matrix-binding ebh n=1 Tax=Babesia caballi TaxID=5871 RepID=A0AAV4LQV5_BABCB|nr:extracellular matrix-binding ebh [Babesia caballi]